MTHPEPFPAQSPWPGSQRAALAILIFVDAQATGTNHGAEEPGIDYAASGLQRLLGILADLDLPATTAWTPAAISLFPQLARNAIDAGHEFALAGPQTSQSDLGAAPCRTWRTRRLWDGLTISPLPAGPKTMGQMMQVSPGG